MGYRVQGAADEAPRVVPAEALAADEAAELLLLARPSSSTGAGAAARAPHWFWSAFQGQRETYTQIEDYKSHLESVLAEVEQLNSERRQEERQRELEIQSLHQEYLDKERMLVQLVMQKTGVNTEMEASEENPLESINLLDLIDLLIKQLHAAQAPHEGMITEHEKELLSKSTSEGLKRALNAKVEHREQKKEQYNATKAAISKRNVELEKKTLANPWDYVFELVTRLRKFVLYAAS